MRGRDAPAWGEAAVPGPRQQVEYIVRSADDTLQFFVHPNRTATSRRAAWRAAVAEVRANVPVPNVPGAVDLYPNDQLVLVAHGLNRSTRPVFQSYFAYNPRLVGLNEAYLRGEHRPRTLFVDISPIDGRWPASEDAPSLLEILARYRLEDDTGQYLIFSRAVVGSVRLHPAGAVASRLGAHVAVPRPTRGPVWASFDVGQSLVGRIEEFLFKQPTLAITATLADGRVVRHRLVPGLAETGFIISPYVGDRGDFAELARGTWRTALASNRVVSIQVDVAGGAVYGYTGRLDVSFMRAEFKPPIARSRR